jgi:diguanylate cyclase (GGDEF)-like protein
LQTRPSIEVGGAAADKKTMRLRFWLGFAVVIALAVGSIAVALVVHERERDSFETQQHGEAVRAAHQTEALAGLSVGQLSSASAFYRAEGHFNRHEFDVVAGSLLRPGALTATAFIGSVPAGERVRFERAHGFPILERGPLGNLRRAGARAHYYPVIYVAAKGLSVQPPIGYDVGSDKLRGAYLLKARDSGRPAATPAMRLPVGGTGINVFRPVYRDGASLRTVAERRAALIGFAGGAFHVPDLAAAAATALPDGVRASLVEHGSVVAGPDLPAGESAAVPIRIADRSWQLVVLDPGRPGVDLPVMIALVGLSLAALLAALVLVWSRSERMHELARQASQDPLTGLKNRRRFEEELRAELARSHRYGVAGALLMLDLDHFKQVNDTLGHPAGDRVLSEIAAVLRGRARETDVLARIGGDEFAIVLPRCEPGEAEEVAGEIATAIRERMSAEPEVPAITASIGIAPFGSGHRLSYEAVLGRADAAMYAAKGSGRDRVRIFDSTTPEPQRGAARVGAGVGTRA